MKAHMLSATALNDLFHHIIDGFKDSHLGILELEKKHLLTDEEAHALLVKNSERLIERVNEFKLLQKLVSIFFAVLFVFMQIQGADLDMRRPSRPGRTASRSGRRNEF